MDKRKNEQETKLERLWGILNWIFWDDLLETVKFVWWVFIAFVCVFVVIGFSIFLVIDKRTPQEKLAEYQDAYELCIERTNLSENTCEIFALEEIGLIIND